MMDSTVSQVVTSATGVTDRCDTDITEAKAEPSRTCSPAFPRWACAGSWLCFISTLAVLVPMFFVVDATFDVELSAGAKPPTLIITDAVASILPFLPGLSAVGIALALIAIVLAPCRHVRTGSFALAANLGAALAILLAS